MREYLADSKEYKTLFPMFSSQGPKALDDVLAFVRRQKMDPPVDEKKLGEAVHRQNVALMRQGLVNCGIKQQTVDVLKAMDDLAPNVGLFLIASLDLTHKMMVLQTVKLFEEADRIKKDYLDSPTLSLSMKLAWQHAYTAVCEHIGRAYDRTLTGTQAMAKMMGTERDRARASKPGFRPLERPVEMVDNGQAPPQRP